MTTVTHEQQSTSGAGAGPYLDVHDLTVHFPTEDGLVKSVDGLSFHVERGRTLGIVGESGSGKSVTSMAVMGLHQGTSAEMSGSIRLDGEELIGASNETVRGLRGKKMAMIFQDPLSSMHPLYTVGNQIIEAYRLHNDVSKKQARAHAIDMLDRVGIPEPGTAGRRLSPPVFRRHAPAGDDCDVAVLRPRPADRRRAHDRARRDGPGADPRPDSRSPARLQRGRHHHHPRPRRGRRAGRRHPRDVRRPSRRVRQRRPAVQRARAPLRMGTARLDAPLRPAAHRAADPGERYAAEPDPRAEGLPVQSAVRLPGAGRLGVQADRPDLRRGQPQQPLRGLPHRSGRTQADLDRRDLPEAR